MRKIYCDICGKELEENYKEDILVNFHTKVEPLEELTEVEDVCLGCLKVGYKIDVKKTLLDTWKLRAVPERME